MVSTGAGRGDLHADGARENRRAALDLAQPMATSIPGRRETNAVAERAVQPLSACVRVLLEQSGLEMAFWPYAA
eukprot:8387211-Alexandrium_andersonii.AAC.1